VEPEPRSSWSSMLRGDLRSRPVRGPPPQGWPRRTPPAMRAFPHHLIDWPSASRERFRGCRERNLLESEELSLELPTGVAPARTGSPRGRRSPRSPCSGGLTWSQLSAGTLPKGDSDDGPVSGGNANDSEQTR
jgi:hypothetical protein